jgi:DNA-binding NtrC family response regulator
MATILCVDDEAPVGVVLENALAGMGHDALLATSVEEAMKAVDRKACDLIISDYSMPNANGLDLMKRLDDAGHEIPVIIMTGFGSIENAVQSIRQGAIDYLTKPLRSETLRIAVNQALEVVRLRKENASFRRELSSLKGLPLNLDELERIAIDRALAETGGHRRKASELLGICERTLRNKLNRPS